MSLLFASFCIFVVNFVIINNTFGYIVAKYVSIKLPVVFQFCGMNKEISRGAVVKQRVKEHGQKISTLAPRMGVSRATLYKRFSETNLNSHFILKVGRLIGYDFSKDFPELKTSIYYSEEADHINNFVGPGSTQFQHIQKKYFHLLEDYNKLLKFLVRLVNDNQLYSLKQEIDTFVENYIKE